MQPLDRQRVRLSGELGDQRDVAPITLHRRDAEGAALARRWRNSPSPSRRARGRRPGAAARRACARRKLDRIAARRMRQLVEEALDREGVLRMRDRAPVADAHADLLDDRPQLEIRDRIAEIRGALGHEGIEAVLHEAREERAPSRRARSACARRRRRGPSRPTRAGRAGSAAGRNRGGRPPRATRPACTGAPTARETAPPERRSRPRSGARSRHRAVSCATGRVPAGSRAASRRDRRARP